MRLTLQLVAAPLGLFKGESNFSCLLVLWQVGKILFFHGKNVLNSTLRIKIKNCSEWRFFYFSQSQGDGVQINLIGPLKTSGVWVGCHGNTIKIVNPHRMQETVLYHNLMANHTVESERLEQPLQLTERYIT